MDINAGSAKLTMQQVRKVVFYGCATQMADRVATNCKVFQSIFAPRDYNKPSYEGDKMDRDQELVLRAYAFALHGEDFKGTLESFINKSIKSKYRLKNIAAFHSHIHLLSFLWYLTWPQRPPTTLAYNYRIQHAFKTRKYRRRTCFV